MSSSDVPGEPPASALFPEAPRARLGAQIRPVILSVLVLTLLTGCVFPVLLFAIGRPLFPRRAGGSLLMRHGVIVGSELIGQQFTRDEYFEARPSAAGAGYDATSSGGTNLGPNNPKLRDGAADFTGIRQLAAEYRKRNGLSADAEIPIDAVTRSGSGLDPDISPENAELQVRRVAHARGMTENALRLLVAKYTKGPQYGFLGQPRVSVLDLNLALDSSGSR